MRGAVAQSQSLDVDDARPKRRSTAFVGTARQRACQGQTSGRPFLL